MTTKRKILITNDDGIFAPGIKHLWTALKDHAELFIVAPATERSGCGLATTSTKPLALKQIDWEDNTPAWSVSGTPADCMKLALSVILKIKPDLIVSGINKGSNSGKNVLYSGTVGGVIEGVLRNIPGLAFSCENFMNPNFAFFEKYIPPIVEFFSENPLPFGSFINVTFPSHPQKGINGLKMARQGKGYWVENPDRRTHPEGHIYYWLGGQWKDYKEEEISDVALLKQGFITAVPIHVAELTDHSLLEKHKDSFEKLSSLIPSSEKMVEVEKAPE
jgi:5'-nucleotidase